MSQVFLALATDNVGQLRLMAAAAALGFEWWIGLLRQVLRGTAVLA